ncbi:MAG: DUF554 domain-containing protein [Halanaerobiales bacterium]
MNGTIVNVFAIIFGSIIGVSFKNIFSERIQKTVMHGLSLTVVLIGVQMALKANNILVIIISLVVGGVIGELIRIEKYLNNIGISIKKKFENKIDNQLFVQGFVDASLIFCVGSMAIMGSIQDGLTNNPILLYQKSLLDGIASIAFAATYGTGVLFSALPVLLYQGTITIMAAYADKYMTGAMISETEAVGGLLIIAIGLNIMGVTKIKTGNMLPSLLIVILLTIIL